jgi:hypothetical protein
MAKRYPNTLCNSITGIFLFLACSINAFTQTYQHPGAGNLVFETKLHYGFIYAHNKELDHLEARFPAFEVNVQKITTGKHTWERIYDYPVLGVAFFYSGLGNNPDLKQVYALMPFINFPIVRLKNLTVGFRLAVGAAYFPKPYDSVQNRENTAIGTHLNAAVNLMFEANCRLSRRLSLSGGIALQHFSNAGWKMPNFGLNVPLASIGIAYRPFNAKDDISQRFLEPDKRLPSGSNNRIEFDLGVGIGYKNRMETLKQNYLVYHFYENTFFPVGRKSKFGFGFDISYDPAQIRLLSMKGYEARHQLSYLQPGINAAYALVISNVEVIMNLGYYTGQVTPNGKYYEKLAIRYNFARHFFTQLQFKAHGTTAAYLAWGAGYKIDLRYGKKKENRAGQGLN